jgi:hypothetical protein
MGSKEGVLDAGWIDSYCRSRLFVEKRGLDATSNSTTGAEL